MLIIFVTAPNIEEAERLASALVESALAACVQILPEMTSVYSWKGAVQKDREHLLLIKSTEEKYAKLEEFVRSNHTYEVPEIVAVRAEHVSDDYLAWLTMETMESMDN